MRKFSISLFLIFLALVLSGCVIKFTAMTKINPDGTGFRISTYSAEGETEKEELVTRYDLPGGGSWKSEMGSRQWGDSTYPYERHIYEVKRSFKDLNQLEPDYIRKGLKQGNVSNNSISLGIRRGILFTTYEYKETFRDSADERQVREFCEKQYNYILDIVSKELESALPKFVEKNKVRAFLDEKYHPYFDDFMTIFLRTAYKGLSEGDNKEFEEKYEVLGEKCNEENFSSYVADYIIAQNRDADRQTIAKKLKETYKKIEEELNPYWEKLAESNYEDAFGVYGWPLFMSYPFEVSVIMPGKIVASNTKDIKKDVAKWTFSREDFFLKDYNLEAKSRRLNYVAIIAFVLGFVIVLILANLKGIRRLWK